MVWHGAMPNQLEIRDYYERTADLHHLTYTYPWAQDRRTKTRELLAGETPVSRFLDVGCGLGGYSLFVAERSPGCEVIGLEIAQATIDMAEQHPAITYVRRSWDDDLTDLGHFDLCLASESFEHAVDPEGLAAKLQVMCDRFVITVPDQWPSLGFDGDGYGHLHVFDAEKARGLFRNVEHCESDGRWLYLVGS
jgi:2-polyprenyl-3-methyl-5-hydroxy-6-metoxy-1,4-benzoquinol methylase